MPKSGCASRSRRRTSACGSRTSRPASRSGRRPARPCTACGGHVRETYEAFIEHVHPMTGRRRSRGCHGRFASASARDGIPDRLARRRCAASSLVGHFSFDNAGIPWRAAGVTVDVTERPLARRSAQAVAEDGRHRAAGRRYRSRLQQPADRILGFAGFLAESLPEPDVTPRDVVEILVRPGARGVTRQLLAFSRKQILAFASSTSATSSAS